MASENIYNKEGQMTDSKVLDILTNSHHSNKIYISFIVSKCPHMPGNPNYYNYFLLFSSKVSGHLTMPAELYIRSVYQIMKKILQQQGLHKMVKTRDKWHYNWKEVHDADRKLRELETR